MGSELPHYHPTPCASQVTPAEEGSREQGSPSASPGGAHPRSLQPAPQPDPGPDPAGSLGMLPAPPQPLTWLSRTFCRHGELRGQRDAAKRVPRGGSRHPCAPHRQLPPAPGHLVSRWPEDLPQQPHVSTPGIPPASGGAAFPSAAVVLAVRMFNRRLERIVLKPGDRLGD